MRRDRPDGSRTGYVPDRGELIWISFDPQAGHEQAGKRPGLVLSPRSYNAKAGLALVCPVTSHQKGYPFEVEIPDGLAVRGVVLCDQIKSLDWKARNAVRAGEAPAAVLHQVQMLLGRLLGFA